MILFHCLGNFHVIQFFFTQGVKMKLWLLESAFQCGSSGLRGSASPPCHRLRLNLAGPLSVSSFTLRFVAPGAHCTFSPALATASLRNKFTGSVGRSNLSPKWAAFQRCPMKGVAVPLPYRDGIKIPPSLLMSSDQQYWTLELGERPNSQKCYHYLLWTQNKGFVI